MSTLITVVRRNGTIRYEPMTRELLYELRQHGQLTDEQLREHLQAIDAFDAAEYCAFLVTYWNKN
jgi:hypothetical protein